ARAPKTNANLTNIRSFPRDYRLRGIVRSPPLLPRPTSPPLTNAESSNLSMAFYVPAEAPPQPASRGGPGGHLRRIAPSAGEDIELLHQPRVLGEIAAGDAGKVFRGATSGLGRALAELLACCRVGQRLVHHCIESRDGPGWRAERDERRIPRFERHAGK